MISYLFFQREGDRDAVGEFIKGFNAYNDANLVDYYNQQQKLGFVGVHRQAQAIVALNIVFRNRFGKSPIRNSDNALIEFTGRIELCDSGWRYIDVKNSKKK